ncbi:glycoside hydrolase family 44 protein [Botrimarina hoheduenensis]|uniref:Beta-mannanase/endoglucanase A n=1 Tax=Botrimarina hoheduenensis TaxID=2528000 RepID=A0A5C5VY36_9BACT|nr:glycoside hydrolase family 44 protein [Botrimarina hoheduenensis]TWT42452.1 Beta-mannanase/endoglucanase A precursor [Botrimarina hoheduenensis]
MFRKSLSAAVMIALLGFTGSGTAEAIEPGDPGPGDIALTISTAAGTTPISPRIYGVNGSLRPAGVGSLRLGGNRWTGYNWETNSSNAGEDFLHYSDALLVGFQPNTPPGQAVLPTLQEAAALGVSTAVTVPMAGYVAADNNQAVLASQAAPSSRWHQVRAKKSAIYPGQPLSLAPNKTDDYVFTDEFVNWVESNRQAGQEVMYLLDNEPGLWDNTHPRLYGTTGPTFADVGQRSIAHASAIKEVAPGAKVLGGVTFGWDAMQSLNSAPDFNQQVPQPRAADGLHFNRWLLTTMAAAEQQQGRVLMDALDLHWYPEARGGGVRIIGNTNNTPAMIEARVQAPRSLWDSTYIEDSYITEFITKDYSGAGNDEGVELLNRVRADIDELKPGTLISISEYNYGGGNHISGGIAQADVLGVFGREGVFNANWWPIEGEANAPFVAAGFEMFTDFDGQGSRFGDLSVAAATSDIAQSSVYASQSTDNPNELVIVAINRTGAPLDAAVTVTDERRYTTAQVYQLTSANPNPVAAGQLSIDLVNAFRYTMPAYSVSTLRLVAAAAVPGDFSGDGQVDNADLNLLLANWGVAASPLPVGWNGDPPVGPTIDNDELNALLGNWGVGTAIPEPATLSLLLVSCAAGRHRR